MEDRDMVAIKKLEAAWSNWGHFNRGALLTGSTPAVWGVYVGGSLVARISGRNGWWDVLDPHNFTRLAPTCFRSAKEAKAWALTYYTREEAR